MMIGLIITIRHGTRPMLTYCLSNIILLPYGAACYICFIVCTRFGGFTSLAVSSQTQKHFGVTVSETGTAERL